MAETKTIKVEPLEVPLGRGRKILVDQHVVHATLDPRMVRTEFRVAYYRPARHEEIKRGIRNEQRRTGVHQQLHVALAKAMNRSLSDGEVRTIELYLSNLPAGIPVCEE